MSLGIRKEDTVHVTTGKYKGRTGRVLKVDKGKGAILIEKINIIKKQTQDVQKMQGGH
jgi:large subunit ribosomal protein L24